MNKKLAKSGSTLNKNMTNTESLNLTDLQCINCSLVNVNMENAIITELNSTNASFSSCYSDYVNSIGFT